MRGKGEGDQAVEEAGRRRRAGHQREEEKDLGMADKEEMDDAELSQIMHKRARETESHQAEGAPPSGSPDVIKQPHGQDARDAAGAAQQERRAEERPRQEGAQEDPIRGQDQRGPQAEEVQGAEGEDVGQAQPDAGQRRREDLLGRMDHDGDGRQGCERDERLPGEGARAAGGFNE